MSAFVPFSQLLALQRRILNFKSYITEGVKDLFSCDPLHGPAFNRQNDMSLTAYNLAAIPSHKRLRRKEEEYRAYAH